MPIAALAGETPPPTKEEFSWKDAIIDAAIIGGMAVVSTLAGLTAAAIEADPAQSALTLGVAFLGPFLGTLAIRRKLNR